MLMIIAGQDCPYIWVNQDMYGAWRTVYFLIFLCVDYRMKPDATTRIALRWTLQGKRDRGRPKDSILLVLYQKERK